MFTQSWLSAIFQSAAPSALTDSADEVPVPSNGKLNRAEHDKAPATGKAQYFTNFTNSNSLTSVTPANWSASVPSAPSSYGQRSPWLATER